MKAVWMIACALLAAVLVVLLLPFGTLPTHGHTEERLDVTMRVVDAEAGRPLSGALVIVARHRDILHPEEIAWLEEVAREHGQDGALGRQGSIAAKRTTDDPETALVSSVCVTYWRSGGAVTHKNASLPEILRVHHAKFGTAIVPIDPEAPLTEGDEPNTWRLDLGTVRVP